MKTKYRQVIRAQNLEGLKNLLDKARSELFLLKLDKTQNKLKNTRLIFWKRKEIAQILTIIKEKGFSYEKSI